MEMMINVMLIMTSLVFCLALIQLCFYCLMDCLDLLDELQSPFCIMASIDDVVLSKSKIHWCFWQITEASLKRRPLCRRVCCMVVSVLHIVKTFIPQLRMLVAVTSKKMQNCPVHYLYLSIGLWIEDCTFLHLGIHESPQR